MKEIRTNAMTKAKLGMDRAHEAMRITVTKPDSWMIANSVFQRHYRIAKYIQKRSNS